MSSQASGSEAVLILRVREDRVTDVLEALKGVDLGVTSDVEGFAASAKTTGFVRMTTIATSARSGDTCIRDLS